MIDQPVEYDADVTSRRDVDSGTGMCQAADLWRIYAYLVVHAKDDRSGEDNIVVVRGQGESWVLPGGSVRDVRVTQSLVERVREKTGLTMPESALTFVGAFGAATDPAATLSLLWETAIESAALSPQEDCRWADYTGLRQPMPQVPLSDTVHTCADFAHMTPLHCP
ncbi:hypothetical protein BJF85_07885 [Saccharomonospora sp. CUA-673]|uniref:hypothetical protein n=1 Tax=Saccharomonospora sp. CUA-673 TaxID=1904969 RepID=UPI0009631770|nr:hypothetical protein [Saccharomonospora sp. CUA-673]OLT39107.1 hypothetical protein BJF85_07885 [Saccharomonospora sp. CUA-673]